MQAKTKRLAGVHAACVMAAVLAPVGAAGHAYAACDKKDVLGVSRTITLDTAGGKRVGGLQYGDSDLLKDREVVLTFDDGPLPRYTDRVLAALKAQCTKATFFMVGRMAVAYPDTVREVEAAGHTIASHTWSHPNLGHRSARKAGGEIELGISTVQKAAANPIAPFFRFPYLADPRSMVAYAKSRDIGVFSIDIDSYDYKTKAPEKVYSTIMSQLRKRGKGIMLFHDIQRSTAFALPRLLDTLQREGYKIVHIVPKTPVKTLADFDATAADLVAKRRTQVAAGEIDGGPFETAGPASRPRIAETSKSSNATRVVLNSKNTGPILNIAPPQTPTPVHREAEKKDWRRAIWGN
jgi:peptidoglycan/xylan/chitin deacetylase (PgdA/CDA1 family)